MLFKIRNSSIKTFIFDIFVVVLGILIAFQVDEWRESRNERVEEAKYLRLIVEDLNTGIEQLAFVEKAVNTSIENLTSVVVLLQDRETMIPEQVISKLVFPLWNWEPTNSAYASLRDSGAMNLLSNGDIYKALVNYHDTFEPYFLLVIEGQRNARERFWEVANEDFQRIPAEDFGVSGRVELKMMTVKNEYPKNDQFLNDLLYIMDRDKTTLSIIEDEYSTINELIEKIELHLDTL